MFFLTTDINKCVYFSGELQRMLIFLTFNVLPSSHTQISLDFQNFQCLPLSPVLNTDGDIVCLREPS